MYLVVDESGVEQGPYTLDEVMSMLTSGIVSPDTLARSATGAVRFHRLASLLAGPTRAAAAAAAAANAAAAVAPREQRAAGSEVGGGEGGGGGGGRGGGEGGEESKQQARSEERAPLPGGQDAGLALDLL